MSNLRGPLDANEPLPSVYRWFYIDSWDWSSTIGTGRHAVQVYESVQNLNGYQILELDSSLTTTHVENTNRVFVWKGGRWVLWDFWAGAMPRDVDPGEMPAPTKAPPSSAAANRRYLGMAALVGAGVLGVLGALTGALSGTAAAGTGRRGRGAAIGAGVGFGVLGVVGAVGAPTLLYLASPLEPQLSEPATPTPAGSAP